MNYKVRWSEQVESYVRAKAPDPRRELWRGIKEMATWDGREHLPKIRRLEGNLTGYCRLRVRSHRIVFKESFSDGAATVDFLFASPRDSVYEAFAEIFMDDLTLENPPGEPSA
jgi:mRNA-degrading endonuclease RelE of RelBE toxin-antitoxin system